jgi:3-methylcrotonyl-CoA carboxylase alpha subunit
MNTRLQVEHPVTEEITGQDLVEWQLRVASGEPLPKRQDELSINGWAMEARLYAEDPAKGFLPSIGRLDYFSIGEGHLVRIETGVTRGGEISPFYDPMIAKIVTHSKTREFAAYQLANACGNTLVAPVKTNAGFLARCLRHEDFRAGQIDTGFIARYEADLVGPENPPPAIVDAAAMAVLHDEMGDGDAVHLWRYEEREEPRPHTGSVWRSLAGFRIAAPPRIRVAITCEGKDFVLDQPVTKPAMLTTIIDGDQVLVADMGQSFVFRRTRTDGAHGGAASDGAILSPMPGRIIAVAVAAGDAVVKGQKLLTLEAMKMEHSLVAPFDGTVAEFNASEGGQVSEGMVLARIDKGKDG